MIDNYESVTAKLCSFARSFHSAFDRNKIFDDYLAFDLLGLEQYEEIGQLIENDFDLTKYDGNRYFCHKNILDTLYTYILPIPLSRIAFAERELNAFAAENGEIQYVILGAGLDSFAYRNENEKIQIFEVDHPATQAYKRARIKKLEWHTPKNLVYVGVDFEKDSLRDRLLESGFDTAKKTFVAFLGVSYYLPLSSIEGTIKVLEELLAKGSRIALDFPTAEDAEGVSADEARRFRELKELTAKLGEPMKAEFTFDEMADVLKSKAFALRTVESPENIQNIYFHKCANTQSVILTKNTSAPREKSTFFQKTQLRKAEKKNFLKNTSAHTPSVSFNEKTQLRRSEKKNFLKNTVAQSTHSVFFKNTGEKKSEEEKKEKNTGAQRKIKAYENIYYVVAERS